MKIAIVNQPIDTLIPGYQNSIAIWTYNVAPLVAETHDVTVYGKINRIQKELKTQPKVRYRFLRAFPNKVEHQLEKVIKPFTNKNIPVFASQLHHLDYALPLALSLRQGNYDVIHVHNFTQFIPVIRLFNPQSKLVLHMHGEWLTQLDYDIMAERIAQTDLVLGSSNYVAEINRRRFPQYAERCKTVYNGVNVEAFRQNNHQNGSTWGNGHRVLFVGRVSPEKGVHDLIKAFVIVAERFPAAQLHIVGPIGAMPFEYIVGVSDDPMITGLAVFYQENYGTTLQKLVPEDLKEKVHFIGGTPHATIMQYYENTDVLVNPSYAETFGMSLVEALASEKPVVATRAGGMVEIVGEQKVGRLVERGDVPGLAAAISELLGDAALRSNMGKLGRKEVVERFSWARVAQDLLAHYESLFR